jgi:hypothetical protein
MVVIAVALPISHLRVAGEKRQYSGGGVQYYTDSSTDLHLNLSIGKPSVMMSSVKPSAMT